MSGKKSGGLSRPEQSGQEQHSDRRAAGTEAPVSAGRGCRPQGSIEVARICSVQLGALTFVAVTGLAMRGRALVLAGVAPTANCPGQVYAGLLRRGA